MAARLAWFVFRNPKATLPTLKFILLHPQIIPFALTMEDYIEKCRALMEEELAQCVAYFEKVETDRGSIDLDYLQKSLAPDIPRWARLYILVRVLRPGVVVETGVAAGESTSYILQALADNQYGFLYSIDLPNQVYVTSKGELHIELNPTNKQSGYLIPPKLKGRWKLILGNTYDKLPELLSQLKQVDLFLHDSEHTYGTMTFEYECAWPHICPGGYLVSDDADWNTSLSDFAHRHNINLRIIEGQGFIQKPTHPEL